MNGYEKRTALKKTAIIDAARTLFFKHGIQNVSIKEIAAQAQVSQVSIYNYFEDKNALAKETFIIVIEEAIKQFEQTLASDISFENKLNIIMEQKVNLTDEILLAHFDKQALDDKILRQVFEETVKESALKLYRDFIELGKKEGIIDSAIPTEAAIDYLATSLKLLQNADFYTTDTSYKAGIRKMFLYGLLGKEE